MILAAPTLPAQRWRTWDPKTEANIYVSERQVSLRYLLQWEGGCCA